MTEYFLIADLLGFSNLVTNLDTVALDKRVQQWVSLIEEAKNNSGVTKVQLISDTLFASEEDSTEGLSRLIGMGQHLLNAGVPKSLPVRGAITHGDVVWGDLTYGKAVVEAHELEASLDWIGIACQPELPGVADLWSWDSLVVYPVPKKEGAIQLCPTIVWTVPNAQELSSFLTRDGLVQRNQVMEWPWAVKVQHTIHFGMYLSKARTSSWPPSQYKGSLPIEILQMWFEGVDPNNL